MFLKFTVQKEVENGEYQVEHKISPAQVGEGFECRATINTRLAADVTKLVQNGVRKTSGKDKDG